MAAPVHNPVVVREFDRAGHPGRDYRTEPGTPIRATLAGVVVQVGHRQVVVESNAIRHLYDHLSEPTVSQGETVETGDLLGLAAGDHLHYEERVAPYGVGDQRGPQFDLHTNARMRKVAQGGSVVEGATEPSGA
ncbi:M23 family metallopeptidase [Kribbella turkmenica]|uniref:M23 family metallopeptidase n=1 Tax=Kribbella turkmenica TaxID=2530375 RepID=A0A4R4X8D5_9ACTN|nr:M23 family metallopeptidase [Kribbella turkmenica]TDD26743.1 M23 family metallopeptidase [Kribbella turkmenica]